ncbi:MAG TPA: AraC family ligand binding domain-containing protein [Ktedonobacteraceae bacterium]
MVNSAKERLTFWHPWPLNQLELLQGTTVTSPRCQQFTQSYVIGTIQAGRGILQYQNTSQEITRGAFYVIEPEEIWSCQAEELTFSHLLVDPTWLQSIKTEIVGDKEPEPHLPGNGQYDPDLSLIFAQLSARLPVTSTPFLIEDIS